MTREANLTRILAMRFIERAEALNYKGVKRDNAALDYFCGAATIAELTGDEPLLNHLKTICALVVAIRGYFGVVELSRKAPANLVPATLHGMADIHAQANK